MATISDKSVQTGSVEGKGGPPATPGVGSPITNDAYNVIAALHSKLEGLEAYRKYSRDAQGDLWRDLTNAEIGCVSRLVDELERIVKEGKLRMVEPGRGKA